MESVYHIVTIRVNETSWAHVWRLRSHCLGTVYDTQGTFSIRLAEGSARSKWAVQLGRLGGFGCEPGARHAIPAASTAGPGMRGRQRVMMLASSWMVAI
jgi:hypothetical protein